MLTKDEIEQVQQIASSIKIICQTVARRDKIEADLCDLIGEMILRLGSFSPILFYYLETLEKENDNYDPIAAYQAGKLTKERGVHWMSGFSKYKREAENNCMKIKQLQRKLLSMLFRMLHAQNVHGLLMDFIDQYENYYMVKKRNYKSFFSFGYGNGK